MTRRLVLAVLSSLVAAYRGPEPVMRQPIAPEPHAPDRGWQRRPTPGYSTCAHCNRSWDQVEAAADEPHTFQLGVEQDAGGFVVTSGFFPVCEPCYQELRRKGQRDLLLAYVAHLWVEWRQSSLADGTYGVDKTLDDVYGAVARDWPFEAPTTMPTAPTRSGRAYDL